MKKVLPIIICLCLLSLGYVISCSSAKDINSVAITIIIDNTDILKLQPEIEKITSLFDLDIHSPKKIETGVNVRITSLSGVDFNRTHDFSIPPVSYMNVNKVVRVKQIKSFYQNIEETFKQNPPVSESRSSVFLPFVRELNRLSTSKAKRKVLVIYSNLTENSKGILNGYREYGRETKEIIVILEKQAKLNNLSGVEVVIRYLPTDELDNLRFRAFSKVYQEMLTAHGAHVSFEF